MLNHKIAALRMLYQEKTCEVQRYYDDESCLISKVIVFLFCFDLSFSPALICKTLCFEVAGSHWEFQMTEWAL